MKYLKSFMCVLCVIALYACKKHKNNYIPSQMGIDSIELNSQKLKISEDKANCFSIAYKKTSNGTKTIHVKLNDAASFDAIFDTGCSGMLISLQEAMSLVKSGTLSQNDILGEQQSAIASGDIIENTVFRLKEVSLTDTEGKSHTLYDVPVTVIENPGASVLVGNIVIDQLAEYSYTIDLKKNVIVFQ